MVKKYRAVVFEASDNCGKSKIRYVIKMRTPKREIELAKRYRKDYEMKHLNGR